VKKAGRRILKRRKKMVNQTIHILAAAPSGSLPDGNFNTGFISTIGGQDF
jgi:hypothetical protein